MTVAGVKTPVFTSPGGLYSLPRAVNANGTFGYTNGGQSNQFTWEGQYNDRNIWTQIPSATGYYEGPTAISLSAIAVGQLTNPLTWDTENDTAAVVTNAALEFGTAGKIVSGGIIELVLPEAQYWSMAAVPTVSFLAPSTLNGVAQWDQALSRLRVTIDAEVAEGTSVHMIVNDITTPPGEMSAGVAKLSCLRASGTVTDGPTDVATDPIAKGVLTNLVFEPKSNAAGVDCIHTLSFNATTTFTKGSKIVIVLPDDKWYLPPTPPNPVFSLPTTMNGTASFVIGTRTLTVTIKHGVVLAGERVTVNLYSVSNPASVVGSNTATISTTLGDGALIDGPATVTTKAFTAGALRGALTFDSKRDAPPGTTDDVTVSFTTNGAIMEGGHVSLKLPSGWVIASRAPAITVKLAPSGVTATSEWDFADEGTLKITTAGGRIRAGAAVQFVIAGVTTPSLAQDASTVIATTSSDTGGTCDGPTNLATDIIREGLKTASTTLTKQAVTSTVSITGLSVAAFDSVAEASFLAAMAKQLEVLVSQLAITSSSNTARRLEEEAARRLAAGLLINFEVVVDDASVATAVSSSITAIKDTPSVLTAFATVLNSELVASGKAPLPAGAVAVTATPSTASKTVTIPGLSFVLHKFAPKAQSSGLLSFTTFHIIPQGGAIVLHFPAADMIQGQTKGFDACREHTCVEPFTTTVTFYKPAGILATTYFNTGTQKMYIKIDTAIAADTAVVANIAGFITPMGARAADTLELTTTETSLATSTILDGPSQLVLHSIVAGNLIGELKFRTPFSNIPGRTTTSYFSFIPSAPVANLNTILLKFPAGVGWSFTNDRPEATIASGVTALTTTWLRTVNTLKLVIGTSSKDSQGLAAGALVNISIADTVNPPGIYAPADVILSIIGGNDISKDEAVFGPVNLAVDALTSGNLSGTLEFDTVVDTPANTTDAQVTFKIDAPLRQGSSFRIKLPNQGWTMGYNALVTADISTLSGGSGTIAVRQTTPGVQGTTNEVQNVVCIAGAGMFKFKYLRAYSLPIAYNADASTVQTAFRAMSNIHDASTVTFTAGKTTACSTDGSNTMTITFWGDIGNAALLGSFATSLARSSHSILITQKTVGVGAIPEVQAAVCTATAGVFTLTYDGQTTAPVAFDATAEQVHTAFVALSSVPASTSVTFTTAKVAACTADGSNTMTIAFAGNAGDLPFVTSSNVALVNQPEVQTAVCRHGRHIHADL
jgi:hypothetical protein